ncbi:hypothetical protein CFP56_025610 [Quercus suber]|uniref:Uncharacterized protein n=1 Tax=Quercus suber TaxID=58331 RepID=A0AAW0K3J9_QUESU
MQCFGFGTIYPSKFLNLVQLDFKLNPSNWHVLQALLLVAPNLEVLVVDKASTGGKGNTLEVKLLKSLDMPDYKIIFAHPMM